MKNSILTLTALTLFLFGTVSVEAQRGGNENNSRPRTSSSSSSETNSSSRSSRENSPSQKSNVVTSPDNGRNSSREVSRDRGNNRDRDNNRNTVVVRGGNHEMKHYPSEKTVVVTRRPERIVTEPHDNYSRVSYRGVDYSYRDGRYYRPNNGSYVVVTPPRGLRVSIIPSGFLTLMVGHSSYYYSSGVYYRSYADNTYEVVDPPMGAIVPELPADDVKAVVIGGKTYFEYDNILYKPVVTQSGVQYKVIGTLDNVN